MPCDAQVDELVDRARPRDALGDAAEVVEHLVGEDDRERDRDQRLAQVLALVPAQQHLLQHDADEADEQRADDERHDPVDDADLRARKAERAALADQVALQAERDVAAEEEERAVRHVDDAHEAEDQREPARHDEVEAGGRDAVEHHDDEVLGVVDGRPEPHVAAQEGDPRHGEDPGGDREPQPADARGPGEHPRVQLHALCWPPLSRSRTGLRRVGTSATPQRSGRRYAKDTGIGAQTLQQIRAGRQTRSGERNARLDAGHGRADILPSCPPRASSGSRARPVPLADGVRARALFGDAAMLNLVELDPGAIVPGALAPARAARHRACAA